MLVLVRRRSVVMIRVIVPDVLVHVQRRCHGRENDHGLSKQEGHETSHGHQSTTRHRLEDLHSPQRLEWIFH